LRTASRIKHLTGSEIYKFVTLFFNSGKIVFVAYTVHILFIFDLPPDRKQYSCPFVFHEDIGEWRYSGYCMDLYAVHTVPLIDRQLDNKLM